MSFKKPVIIFILAVTAAVVIGGVIVINRLRVAAPTQAPSAQTGEEQPPVQPGATPTTSGPKPSANQLNKTTPLAIASPQAGENIVIGQIYTIKWSKESGVKGFVYLSDAATKKVVGWINSETDPHDTSYTWDTRYIFPTRYSPVKNPLQVGKYTVSVGFESAQYPTVTSGIFSIIYPSQVTIGNYKLTIKNYLISPSTLTVKKGSTLTFINQDPVIHKISYGSTYFTIDPGESYSFDTSILFPGAYDFYSEQYPTARTTITVQ